ncbi:peptidylprolyl isomerase [Candidatus Woesearchaeota archaeon]|nr:peptidylprolyl isomerase [Candidatus Woesearchaeota archaeon]
MAAEIIKKGDFIQLEYTGLAEGRVFDTTNEKLAKEAGLYREGVPYGHVTICVGQANVLPGLDEDIVGKEIGKQYAVKIEPEKAFGKKLPNLIQLIPKRKFKEAGIDPKPGMPVTIDNAMAVIRTVSGGRILVDFNHPLSGKVVEYTYKPLKIVTDAKEKVESVIAMDLNLKKEGYDLSIENDTAKIKFKKEAQIPNEIQELLSKKLTELAGVKKVEFQQ